MLDTIKLIDIALLNSCNFHCDYCISGALKTNANNDVGIYDVHGPLLDPLYLLPFIERYFDTTWTINITGGEPLTHPSVVDILNHLVLIGYNVILSTNGELLNLKHRFINSKVHYRISLHPDYRETEEFIANLHELDIKDRSTLCYMVHPRHIETGKVHGYREKVIKSGFRYQLTAFDGKYNGANYKPVLPLYDPYTDQPVPMHDFAFVSIKPNGLVTVCHNEDGVIIGDMYKGTYDSTQLFHHNCSICGMSACASYDSLYKIERE